MTTIDVKELGISMNVVADQDTVVRLDSRTRKPAIALLALTAVAMLAQILPFVIWQVPDAAALSAALPPAHYPAGYTSADYGKAHALDLALFWGGLIRTGTILLTLLTILLSGAAERVGAVLDSKGKAWAFRLFFLLGVFVCLQVSELPFRYCCFAQYRALGLNLLTLDAWVKVLLVGMAIPLVLFVLKYVFVICTVPLGGRFWWIAAALGLFLVADVIPEMVSRTYPLDAIADVKPLEAGPSRLAVERVLHKAGLDLPVMIVDQSRRSKSANVYLTGRAGREVLITDTFLQDYTPLQVGLALAHELGHFQHKLASLVVDKCSACLHLLLTFGLTFLLSGRQRATIGSAPRIVVVSMLCSLFISNAFAPVSLALSRKEEAFADRYALTLADEREEYGGLLLKVAQHEFEPLDLPAWRYYLSASHPTVLDRMGQGSKR